MRKGTQLFASKSILTFATCSIVKLAVDQGSFVTFTGWSQIGPMFETLFQEEYGAGAEVSVQDVKHTAHSTVLSYSVACVRYVRVFAIVRCRCCCGAVLEDPRMWSLLTTRL